MALIPLNQTVLLHKRIDGNGGLDEWGNPIVSDPISMEARVDEGSFTTTDEESFVTGKVIVAQVRVFLEGLADISYDDEVEFTNELNHTIKRKPKRINIKRNIAGAPELTEVLL
jgi:hypothetical protein